MSYVEEATFSSLIRPSKKPFIIYVKAIVPAPTVINRVANIADFGHINRVRVLGGGLHTPTQLHSGSTPGG